MQHNNNELVQLIKKEIDLANGYINFAHFMQLVLYTPKLGYYSNAREKFGKEGDFITAPLISPLFAACLVEQFAPMIQSLGQADILEIGAGRGHLARDLLLGLARKNALPAHYLIHETSESLRKAQRDLIYPTCKDLPVSIEWVNQPPEGLRGIIFANEVLDALPFQIFKIEQNQIIEKGVTVRADKLTWLDKISTHPQLIGPVHELVKHYQLPNGYESEIRPDLPQWLNTYSNALEQGALMMIDYGYGAANFYHRERKTGTYTCFHQHQFHHDPFINIGQQDITAHVDFTQVAEAGVSQGLKLAGFTTQAGFLLSCGLLSLAEQAQLTHAEAYTQANAIKKLILPGAMGEIVKVIGFNKNFNHDWKGFSLQDRRHELS